MIDAERPIPLAETHHAVTRRGSLVEVLRCLCRDVPSPVAGSAFQLAMEGAESDEVRNRLEKASMGCHALIVEPVVYRAHQKVRTRKRNRDEDPLELDPQVARRVRPHLQTFFDLCRRHGVVNVGEWGTYQEVEAVLREWYGMEEGEAF